MPEENCFNKVVWREQCVFAQCVYDYVKKLEFGIVSCEELDELMNSKRLLEILNCLDKFCEDQSGGGPVPPIPQPTFSYNCVDCQCVPVAGTLGTYPTLEACQAACTTTSCAPCESCEELNLCLPCEGCINPLQYIFNLSLNLFCRDTCFCVNIEADPIPDNLFSEPYGIFDENYYYLISISSVDYYLWYNKTEEAWYLTSALGDITDTFAILERDANCASGIYTSLASPITQFNIYPNCLP
jgi:hypothetical protein